MSAAFQSHAETVDFCAVSQVPCDTTIHGDQGSLGLRNRIFRIKYDFARLRMERHLHLEQIAKKEVNGCARSGYRIVTIDQTVNIKQTRGNRSNLGHFIVH